MVKKEIKNDFPKENYLFRRNIYFKTDKMFS